MIRKSDIAQYIDRYLNQELTDDELTDFNAEMAINPDIEEEIALQQDIEAAISETDITALRANMQAVIAEESAQRDLVDYSDYSFELSEDMSSFNQFKSSVSISDIVAFAESLPKLHLAQYKIAEKENIHPYYKEQIEEQNASDEEFLLSPEDEAIFAEVEQAMAEREISELRDNLQHIAANMPAHEYDSKELDEYINQEMDPNFLHDFESELAVNEGLMKDVELYRHVDQAIGETDIMDLRASLSQIHQTESSTSHKIEEIDRYLNSELDEDERSSFENELTQNPDLAAELELHKEIAQALVEDDVMNLRDQLDGISEKVLRERRKERSFVARIPRSRITAATIAASLILLIGITSLLKRNSTGNEEKLYSQYFRPYEATGIFRSSNSDLDSKINLALHKYNAAEYTEAINLFEEVLQSDLHNPVGNFYQGMSFQELGKYDRAIHSYNEVIKAKNNLFVEQAEWYAALCYMQNDNRRKAYKQFKQIAENNGYYSEKASAILRKLADLE